MSLFSGKSSDIVTKFMVTLDDIKRWAPADIIQEVELPARYGGTRRYKLLREMPAGSVTGSAFLIARYEPTGARYMSRPYDDQLQAEFTLALIVGGQRV